MPLLEAFQHHLQKERLVLSSDHLLVAVSGGVDSVTLCELCYQSAFTFQIAHANFQLRGQESDDDEQFVRELAEKYRVPVHVRPFDTASYAASEQISVQMAARMLRYNWFNELLAGSQWLLTAHHQGDNVETVLMNFFRGTGISGLHGIAAKSGRIVRPLLPFTRNDILHYAKERQLSWREDSSNESEKYARNYFRNTVLATVRKIFPEAEQNLAENIWRFREAEELYCQAIEMHKKRLIEQKGEEVHISVLKLHQSQPLLTILYEIIKDYGFTPHQVKEVAHLLDAEQGKLVSSSTHRIIRNRRWLIIAPVASSTFDFIVVPRDHDQHGPLQWRSVPAGSTPLPSDSLAVHLDAEKLEFPLMVRKWKPGDYFYPLGMTKKKKIARFLIDKKISATDKEKVRVVESNKRICWVVGLRIDERFKVRPASTSLIELVWTITN